MKSPAAILAALLLAGQAVTGSIEPRAGWEVHDTEMGYQVLIDSLKQAVKAREMAVVTEAGPTEAAAVASSASSGTTSRSGRWSSRCRR